MAADEQKTPSLLRGLPCWSLMGTVLALHVALGLGLYIGAGQDDVFISLWQGKCVAEGHGFVNHNYEAAEISSSLLHTCVIALLHVFAPDQLFVVNKLTGFAIGCLTLLCFGVFRRAFFGHLGPMAFAAYAATLLLTATNPSFLYWNMGGLETPYVAFLLLLYAGLARQLSLRQDRLRPILLGITGSALVATRPEAFYIILFGVVLLLVERRLHGFRWVLLLPAALPALVLFGLTLWRAARFGMLMPAPVYAKTSPLSYAVPDGASYVLQFYQASGFLSFAGVAAIISVAAVGYALLRTLLWPASANKASLVAQRYPLGLLITVNLVVLLAGGDWMEYFRFLAPTVPLLVWVTVDTASRAAAVWARRKRDRPLQVGLAMIAALLFVGLAEANTRQIGVNRHGTRAVDHTASNALPYTWGHMFQDWQGLQERAMRVCRTIRRDQDALGPFVQRNLPAIYQEVGRLVIVTNQMGYFPYRLRQCWPRWNLHFVDLGGLCEPGIARLPLRKYDPDCREYFQIDQILAGRSPHLSEYVLAQSPNMVYTLGYASHMELRAERLGDYGYEEVWNRPGARIFFRPEREEE